MIGKRCLTVYYQNLLVQLKQVRRNSLFVVVPMVVFFLLYQFVQGEDVTTRLIDVARIGVVNLDGSSYTKVLIEDLRNKEEIGDYTAFVVGEELALRESFQRGELDLLVVIPEGFVDQLLKGEALSLEANISYDHPIKGILFKNVLRSYEEAVHGIQSGSFLVLEELGRLGFDREDQFAYTDRLAIELVVTALGRGDFFDRHPLVNIPSTSTLTYYFIGVLVMFMMYLSMFSAIQVIRERQQMCLNRLWTTKTTKMDYFFGKALGNTTFLWGMLVLWFVLYRMIAGNNGLEHYGWMIGFLGVCLLFYVSLIMFLTVFFSGEEPVILLGTMFVFFSAILGGSIIPIQQMPYILQKLAIISPNYWMIKGFLYLAHDYKTEEITVIAFVLVGVSIGLILITSFIYSKKETME